MGSLDERDVRLIAGARRRAVDESSSGKEKPTEEKATDDESIDVDNDPAPELPKLITLPRDVVFTTLGDAQDFSFRRVRWGWRRQAQGPQSAP